MKKILTLSIMFVLTLALVACGGDRGTGTGEKLVEWYELSENAAYDGSAVTINFWHRMGGQNQIIVQNWITEFNAVYPNITVNEEKVADDYGALADKISYAIPSKTTPHIAESYPDHIARYATGNAPLALNNFINHPTLGYTEAEQQDFLSGLWAEGSSYDTAGTMLSLPFTKSSEALFYNKAYFDAHGYEAPTTWDELFAIAEDIKKREPDSIPFGYDSEDNLFISASAQWDAPYTGYNETTGQGEVLFNNDASKDMVKYFKDKVDRGLMITRTLNNNAYTSDIMKTGEKLYMYVGSTGGSRYAYADSQDLSNYSVGVVPVPAKNASNRKQIQQGPNINLFVKDNEQEMIAAWLFTKFMLEAERTAEFALQSGYAPIRHSAYETETWTDYIDKIEENPTTVVQAQSKIIKEAIEMFRENESIFFTSAVFNLSSKTRTEVGQLLVKILSYTPSGTTDEQKLANLNQYINAQYQESQDFIIN